LENIKKQDLNIKKVCSNLIQERFKPRWVFQKTYKQITDAWHQFFPNVVKQDLTLKRSEEHKWHRGDLMKKKRRIL
jgi:hypothetical protein